MSREVVVRPFTKGDEEGIVALLQTVFKGWPHFDLQCSPLNHWLWKYEDNPLRSKAVIVAESDHRIVGCTHGYYLKVKVGQRSLLAQQGTDLAVLEDFRGMGLYPKMIVMKNEIHKKHRVNMTYALSSNPIVYKKDLKENRPQFPSQLKHYVKIWDVSKHFSTNPGQDKLLKKYGYTALKTMNKLGNIVDSSGNSNTASSLVEILETSVMDNEMGDFWDLVKGDYNFIVERDTIYMNWRYHDRRGGEYSVRYARDSSDVLGFMVLRVNKLREDYPVGYVVDLLAQPKRLDVVDALLRDALHFFKERGVNMVHSMVVKGHPYDRLFMKHGFLYDREKLILFYSPKDVGEELNDLTGSPPNKLHFTYGDLDWI
jgi:hypothetical protein